MKRTSLDDRPNTPGVTCNISLDGTRHAPRKPTEMMDTPPSYSDTSTEISQQIDSFESWQQFYRSNKFLNNQAYLEHLAGEVSLRGFDCPLLCAHAAPTEIHMGAPNFREGLIYKGINSRQRAVARELCRRTKDRHPHELRIFAPEAVTEFALAMRGVYPRFIGSEYSEDPNVIDKLFPIPCESLLCLSFPDDMFDVAVVNDVFEHVPDIDKSLRELARITLPGGVLISTFPFNIGSERSIVKASVQDSGINYLMEPEYHGNPVDPKGCLVFEIPGWDIIARAKNAGWASAWIQYETSIKHGIIGGGFSGIFVLVAMKGQA